MELKECEEIWDLFDQNQKLFGVSQVQGCQRISPLCWRLDSKSFKALVGYVSSKKLTCHMLPYGCWKLKVQIETSMDKYFDFTVSSIPSYTKHQKLWPFWSSSKILENGLITGLSGMVIDFE